MRLRTLVAAVWSKRVLLALAILVNAAVALFLAIKLYSFGGGAVPAAIEARCQGGCSATVTAFDAGRARVTFAGPKLDGVITINPGEAEVSVAVVRLGLQSEPVTLAISRGNKTVTVSPLLHVSPDTVPRTIVDLPASEGPVSLMVSGAINSKPGAAVVFEEVGLFQGQDGLSSDGRALFHLIPVGKFYGKYLPQLIFSAGLISAMAMALRRHRTIAAEIWLATLALVMTSAAALLAMSWTYFHPFDGGLDMRAFLARVIASGPGDNLGYGPFMGSNLLLGNGPTHSPGAAPWNRMPGYAFFGALGGLIAGGRDAYSVALGLIAVQVITTSLAVGFLFRSLRRIVPTATASLTTLAVGLIPSQVFYSQVDSLVPMAAMVMTGCACRFIAARRDGKVPLAAHIHLHAGFAFWFALRPDVTPGWAVVSLILYWRTWRYLSIPMLFYLAIGVPWALFKLPTLGAFAMSTTSMGHSAVFGLWEIPQPFIWRLSDGGVGDFLRLNGYSYATPAGDRFAMQETIRFWMTFPAYMVSLVWHELLTFVTVQAWPGEQMKSFFISSLRGNTMWAILALITMSLVGGYHRFRTFLLGWPVLFNMPVFFLVYSSAGRFYGAVSVALLCAVLPLILDLSFWHSVVTRWRVHALIAVLFGVCALWGQDIDDAMLSSPRFRFFAPFLDPAASKVYVLREREAEPSHLATGHPLPLSSAVLAYERKASVGFGPEGNLQVRTASTPWAYAATLPIPSDLRTSGECTLWAKLRPSKGSVVLAVMTEDLSVFVAQSEIFKDYSFPEEFQWATLRIPSMAKAGKVMITTGGDSRGVNLEVASLSIGDCHP